MKDKSLWRKTNNRPSRTRYYSVPNPEYRWDRSKLKSLDCEIMFSPMKNGKHKRNIRDYTPLFRFLQSCVGQNWDSVHSRAVSRLDAEGVEKISWIVLDKPDIAIVRVGEHSYWHTMFVDEDGTLQFVDKRGFLEVLKSLGFHQYGGWTYSVDGKPLTNWQGASAEAKMYKNLSTDSDG